MMMMMMERTIGRRQAHKSEVKDWMNFGSKLSSFIPEETFSPQNLNLVQNHPKTHSTVLHSFAQTTTNEINI
jgi:hypothetical protein